MMRKIFCVVMAVAMAWTAAAQTSIQVQTHNVVDLNEQFNVTFVIEGESSPSDFSWECPADFDLVWGPQRSSSSSISIINGKRTSSKQVSFTYILHPKAVGSFTLPPATAKVKGEQISSREVSITVLNEEDSQSSSQSSSGASSGAGVPSDPSAAGGNSRSQSGSSSSSSSSQSQNASTGEIILSLSLDKTNVVVGQPIYATLKIYQRANLSGFEGADFPSFTGFWSQEVEAPTNIEFQRENYNGKIYDAAVLRRYLLIPQQTGKLRIEPAELTCLVNVRVQSRTGSIFDGFFDDIRQVRQKVSSQAVTVNVSPLPSGAPASFGGGVGKFSISARLAKPTLKAHEANSLIVTVSGKGNVSLLEAPKVKFPLDMEVYDTKITDKSSKGTLSGSKEFEFPFIPRSHGEFTIDPIQYSYYDTESGRYVTVQTQPISFTVEKGADIPAGTGSGSSLPIVQQNDVRNLGHDIRFISTKPAAFREKGWFFVGSAAFVAICLGILLAAALCWFAFRKVAAARADVVGNRNRKATRKALKQLKTASVFLKQNLYTAFYEELHKALLGFIADKLNIPMSELTKENISARLSEGGVDGETVSEFVGLLDECDFARYSPSAGNEAMQAHYEKAAGLISTIDSSMKSSKKKSSAPSGAAYIIAFALLTLPLGLGAQNTTSAATFEAGSLAPENDSTAVSAATPAEPEAATLDYPQQLWQKANAAYSNGNWNDAIKDYGMIASLGIENAQLYYNLGNANFKAGNLPEAILNYERALKIDPSYADARYNLEFASTQTQDRIEAVPEFILKTWTRKVCYLLGSDQWAIIFLVGLALLCSMILLFFLSPSTAGKRTGFILAIVLLLFDGAALGFSLHQKNDYSVRDEAIVMSPVISAKSSPSQSGNMDLFVLHEGTKVTVIDTVGDWYNISISDGRQGWVRASDLEVI